MNECVKRNENRDEVAARETKDDLDEDRMECKGVKGFERVDEEVGAVMNKDDNDEDLENDDSGGSGHGDNGEMKSNEMIVVGGAKRKRKEDGLGSEQKDYGKGQVSGGWNRL